MGQVSTISNRYSDKYQVLAYILLSKYKDSV